MTYQILHDKIDLLPKELTGQVADYLDFLLERYGKSEQGFLLTQGHKDILQKAHEDHQENPDNARRWEDVREELFAKYGRKGV